MYNYPYLFLLRLVASRAQRNLIVASGVSSFVSCYVRLHNTRQHCNDANCGMGLNFNESASQLAPVNSRSKWKPPYLAVNYLDSRIGLDAKYR